MIVRRCGAACTAIGLVFLLGSVSCRPADTGSAPPPAVVENDAMATPPVAGSAVIEVVATDYAFTAPPKFPSGWVTLRLENDAEQPHFVVLWRLPEDKDFADFYNEVVAPFGRLYKDYRAGTTDQPAFFAALTAELPGWFPPESRGGVALTSPGHTSETTVYLEPGEYVMECYVRAPDPDGAKFHNELGMLRPLIVTEDPSGLAPPEADIRMSLSNYEIAIEGELTAGRHTAAVTVTEAPEGLLGHDINLVRLDANDRVEDIAAWMIWVDALQPPAPAQFLGGVEQIEPGATNYFAFDLEPGRYAWISESYGVQGMFQEFTVR